MGELAKKMVSLSGPESVLGIIPAAIMPAERPDPAGGTAKEPAKKKTWTAWIKETFKNTKKAKEEMSLLNEETYGRTKIVSDMSARKRSMIEEVVSGGSGSGFIALSGGFGTMDELMETVTLGQQGVHNHGVCLLNVDGFWDGVMNWMECAIQAGFIKEEMKVRLASKDDPEECVEFLRHYWGNTTREMDGKKLATLTQSHQ